MLERVMSRIADRARRALALLGVPIRFDRDLDERAQRAFDELKQARLVQPTRDLSRAVLDRLRALQNQDETPR
jgi:hypothetical protein